MSVNISDDDISSGTKLVNVPRLQIRWDFDENKLHLFVLRVRILLLNIKLNYEKRISENLKRKICFPESSLNDSFGSLLQRRCTPQTGLNRFGHPFGSLSGPDFLKMSSKEIEALPLDALRNLALRSQRLLATATFAFDIHSFFYLMPEKIVLYILLEFLYIEDLARFDSVLTNRQCRMQYLFILQNLNYDGVFSFSRRFEAEDSVRLLQYGLGFCEKRQRVLKTFGRGKESYRTSNRSYDN